MEDTQPFTLPAGTARRRNGRRFVLVTATLVLCRAEDWPLIARDFVPTVSYGPEPEPKQD